MERRKSMSRKQTSRTIKENEDNALPLLSEKTINLPQTIDSQALQEESVYEHSQIYEEDETIQN